jgi:hypothetical protein
MRLDHPTSLAAMVAATVDGDRYRDFDRHAGHRRALHGSQPARPSPVTRVRAAVMTFARRDHSLTDYPCRLPNGQMGRVAAIRADGEWTLVCRPT